MFVAGRLLSDIFAANIGLLYAIEARGVIVEQISGLLVKPEENCALVWLHGGDEPMRVALSDS